MLRYLDIESASGERGLLHGSTPTRALVKADGLVGVTGRRGETRARSSDHGSRTFGKWRKDRIITLKGEVWGPSPEGAQDELDRVNALLAGCADGPRIMRYGRGLSGAELRQEVRLAGGGLRADLTGNKRFIPYEVTLRADDPRAYSDDEVAVISAPMGDKGGGGIYPATYPVTFEASAAGVCAFDHVGSAATPQVLRIYGEATNPRVRLGDTGPAIVIQGTVASGDYLELDRRAPAGRRVLLNGETPRSYLLDFAETRWFELPAQSTGHVNLLAESASPDAYLSLHYRHAYG